MDIERVKYIITYFSNLLTGAEKMAIKHTNSTYKLQGSTLENLTLTRIYREEGWLTSDQTVLDLLKDGYETFEFNIAKRILNQNKDKVFFNNCPRCNKLARTPYARQCRYCGHSWHSLTVGQFLLSSSFQLTGRYFFLLGQITSGKINQGNYMDLTILGLNCKPKIEAIEFALKCEDGKVWEDMALGTSELTDTEKEHLVSQGSFGTPFDIINDK